MSSKKTFNYRSLTSFVTMWTFLGMAFSGLVLFATPQGKIANWTNWSFLNITKEGWEGVHNILMILFFVSIGLHIYYNWKVLLHYFKSRATRQFTLTKELVVSLVIVSVFLSGAVMEWQPFWSIQDLNESIKNYWAAGGNNPPAPHAEDLTLAELTDHTKTTVETMLADLEKNNITIPSEEATLTEIAKVNSLTPDEIYGFFSKGENAEVSLTSAEHLPTGGGYGMMTIEAVSKNNGVEIQKVIETLKEKNITAETDETLRIVADRNEITPKELFEMIAGGGLQ
ncbi:DUF4405 domain-containing protein [candidate division KSB1 bacterium]